MKVSYDSATKNFIWKGDFKDRGVAESFGFIRNPMSGNWETRKLSKAIRLREYFDASAEERINCTTVKETPWPGGLFIPEGQELRDFQKEGVQFILDRNHSYLAFEQGLGKTPTAIAAINAVALPTLITCPPYLVENWKRELRSWLTNGDVDNFVGGKQIDVKTTADVLILPDTLLDRDLVHQFLGNQDFGLLVVDEAHRFKSYDARRTVNLFGEITKMIPKIVCLSGTPMPARPIELYPVLSALAHDTISFMSKDEYGSKFCNGHQKTVRGKDVWDYRGASNLSDLYGRIHGKFMMRVEKKHYMEPKVENVISLSGKYSAQVTKLDRALRRKYTTTNGLLKDKELGAMATYRQAVGVEKIPLVVQYVTDLLESTNESVLLLAWHKEVIAGLQDGLKDFEPEMISGETKMKSREGIIEDFQKGKTRVLVGQIGCMVGFNLTKASRVVFAEMSWTPGDNDQATDRAHRIGQQETVVVDYLALANTLDENILESLKVKKRNINLTINR